MYELKTAEGETILPDEVTFYESSATITGKFDKIYYDNYLFNKPQEYIITAYDISGKSVSDTFVIEVKPSTEYILTFALKVLSVIVTIIGYKKYNHFI